MVETKVDVIRPTPLSLSQAEVDEIEALMTKGDLPLDFLDRCDDARVSNVFGHDHKTDRHGNPIEQGIGSAGNQTANSINAYKKYAKYEPDYTEAGYADTIKRMQAELTASNETRAAAGTTRRKRGRRS